MALYNRFQSGEYKYDNLVIEYPRSSSTFRPIERLSLRSMGLFVYVGQE